MLSERCETCRFYKAPEQETYAGFCRRRPPTVVGGVCTGTTVEYEVEREYANVVARTEWLEARA